MAYKVETGEILKLRRSDDPLIYFPEILNSGERCNFLETIFPRLGAGLRLALRTLMIPEDVGTGEGERLFHNKYNNVILFCERRFPGRQVHLLNLHFL